MVRKSRKQFTIRFLHRTMLFLVFFSLGLVLLYLFGNGQDFLDSSQYIVLRTLSAATALSLAVSLMALVLEAAFFIRRRQRVYLSMSAASLFCLVFSLAGALLSRGILLASAGIGR